MNNSQKRVGGGGVFFDLIDPDGSVDAEVFSDDGYEPGVIVILKQILENAPCPIHFFDVGAHYGFYSKLAKLLAPDSTVFCFEPGLDARAVLTENLKEFDRCFIRDELLTDRQELRPFAGRTIVTEDIQSSERISSSPFDDLGIELDGGCNILKIDVHGAEAEVLKGMVASLRKFHYVFAEIHAQHLLTKYTYEDVLCSLESTGFVIFEMVGFRDSAQASLRFLTPEVRDSIVDYRKWKPEQIKRERMIFAFRP